MSYLARVAAPLRNAGRLTALRNTASFHTSSLRRALSEDHPHTEDRAQKIDTHKKDSLEKAKTGKGEWKPELASQSEQGIAADKHDMTMEEMQKMGENKGEKENKGQ